ncbi:MAG TPA: TonB-dependent receptor, partial [Thermoanaerobaculia bacterium]|nr:TonB-dependent receptor [Thermoanaerobaculia bacterium]
GKLTGQITPKHNLVGSYLNVKTTENNNFFPPIYDTASIVLQRQLPNSLKALSYNGVLTSNMLIEGQVSQKKFAFVHSGGLFKDQIQGTWISDGQARWNAPVFCGVCTNEERNNDSATMKGNYYLNTKSLGTHNFAVGGDLYKETRLVNNNQSASDFNIGISSRATFLPGDPTAYPTFDKNTNINYQPILITSTGDHLNTKSVFANDKWDFNNHWSFNVGVRYDKNNAHDASGNLVSDDSAFAPRLGAIWDMKGDGRSRINLSYATYVTKIVDGNVGGAANAAGSPARFTWAYGGPTINPLSGTSIVGTPVPPAAALQMLFNWFNANCSPTPDKCGINSSNFFSSNYPGFTQRILSPIASPKVNEINLGYGQQISRNGFARVDFINRRWKNFYARQLNKDTAALGTITAPNGSINDVAYLVNDNSIKRKYDAAQLTFGWNPSHWNIGGGYTYAKLRGSDTTESDGTASSPLSPLALFYPEYLGYANRVPEGYLYGDQRHRAKVWAGYDFATSLGNMNVSAIQSADSGRAFSAVGAVSIAPGAYTGAPTAASTPYYVRSQLGTSADYFFSPRGAFRTPSVFSTDLAYNWNLPAFAKTTVFLQAQALNIFNNSKVATIVGGQLDTTVKTSRTSGAGLAAFNPFTGTPIECPKGTRAADCTAMGANWQLGDAFGQGISKDAYQTPRTYRFAVGLRF